jgi:hypothetical protein
MTSIVVRRLAAVTAVLAFVFVSGCASQTAYMTHWQEAREGAAGGYGVQSGGCGCK